MYLRIMVLLNFCVNPDLSSPYMCHGRYAIPRFPNLAGIASLNQSPLSVQRINLTLGVQKLEKYIESPYTLKHARGIEPQVLADILRDSGENDSIRNGKLVHGYLLKSNFSVSDSLNLFNHVVKLYCKCSDFDHAHRMFDEMPQKDVVSWTTMIVGSTQNGLFFNGFDFFCDMLNSGIIPDEFVYSAVMQSCIGLDCIKLGEGLHGQILKRGFRSNVIVSTALLSMYSKLGDIRASIQAFNDIPKHNHVSWGAMIHGLTLNGLHLEAFEYFLSMKNQGIVPNVYTLSSVLKAVGNLKDIARGREIHSSINDLGLESYVILGTSLIDMYSKCGYLSDARSVFTKNFIKSKVNNPWNAMISGCLQSGLWLEALELFVEMHKNNIQQDVYTYSTIFSAISELRWFGFGRQVHGLVLKSSISSHLSINNAIAGAYSNCWSLEDARMVFDRMGERDVISWTTMVTAFARSYRMKEALEFLSKMRDEGFMPNEYALSSVIVECGSVSLITVGRQVHGLLCKVGLDPHNCIVSSLIVMYAKSNDIISALRVFERMDRPDVVSWTAIISSCAEYGLSNMAHELSKKMENSGYKPNAFNPLMQSLCVN